MRINNIVIYGAYTDKYLGDNHTASQLREAVQQINHLFKASPLVKLEFTNSSSSVISNAVYPDAEAIADDRTIIVFTDRIHSASVLKLVVHEYVHVCIAKTFLGVCPVWLNEGLAVYLSGQGEDIKPICPADIERFYFSNQGEPLFYNMALYTACKLTDKLPISQLVDAARNCRSFCDDPIFGIRSIESLCTDSVL